ncbi:MAG: hypothetical protein U0821_27805 [Chloroflexota bacterium]
MGRTATVWRALSLVASLAVALYLAAAALPGHAQRDQRYFEATGFRIDDDVIWDYFSKRGATRTFGLPTSRTFQFQGAPTQFFQRQVVQVSNGTARTLNLLDRDLLPYTTVNGSTFPGADAALTAAAPAPGPNYDTAIVEFVRQNAPDSFEGMPVRFYFTFGTTVALGDAFPQGGGNSSLLPLLNLELWGAPTSRPARDPNNGGFVYQRFQRGIMHYDDACKCTQGLLLADMLKAILTGQNLPADLGLQAANSPFFKQYDPAAHNGPLKPDTLANTSLANAFRPSLDGSPPGAISVARAASATSTPSARATTAAPTSTPAPSATAGATRTRTPTTSNEPTPIPGSPPAGDPATMVLRIDEAGKVTKKDSVKQADEKSYADGRQKWYAVRYERPQDYASLRSGPVTVYSKVIIAKDVDTAREIYREQVALNEKFPEAKVKVGSRFDFDTEGDEYLGEEAAGMGACNDNCSSDPETKVHRRLVVRQGDKVGVVYTWGLSTGEKERQEAKNLGNEEVFVRQFAAKMVERMG